MKEFLILLLIGLVGLSVSRIDDIITTEYELTCGAEMDRHISEFVELIRDIDFNCDTPFDFHRVCASIGVELIWEVNTLKNKKGEVLYGQASKGWIKMGIEPCNEYALGTFFHEVGHVLLKHVELETQLLLDSEAREGEAHYFASQVLQAIGEPIIDSRQMNTKF